MTSAASYRSLDYWIQNPWGWPSRFGLGDEAASHPVDPDYPMLFVAIGHEVWNEELQMEYSIDLKKCRVCGVPTEGWALDGLHAFTRVQAWCEKHCLAEFEEHDLLYEDHVRYCKRCGWEESPEATAQWERDREQDFDEDWQW